MKVFEYMGWCKHRYASKGKLWGTGICTKCKEASPIEHHLDGQDMVLAIQRMQERGDYPVFFYFAMTDYEVKCSEKEEGYDWQFSVWLFGDPTKFFELMEAWREEVEKNEKGI